jgi:hypothetical protein
MAKRKAPPDKKSQKERFIEKAREIEADESSEAFERAFRTIVPPRNPPKQSQDCLG